MNFDCKVFRQVQGMTFFSLGLILLSTGAQMSLTDQPSTALAISDQDNRQDGPAAEKQGSVPAGAAQLSQLATAVAANPTNFNARGAYAQALFQVGNLPAAWEQLVAGYPLKPDHTGINRGLTEVLAGFKEQGLFRVGTPMATYFDLLGNSAKELDMPWGKRLVYACLALDFREGRLHELIDLRGATEQLFLPTEFVSVEFDGRGWSVGVREKNRHSTSAQFFLPGESIADWREMIQVERILNGASSGTMSQITRLAIDQVLGLKSAESRGKHQIIDSHDDWAIVAFEDFGPVGKTKIHQLVRYFRGPVDVHKLTYRVKQDQPPSREMQIKWLEIFRSAALEPLKR